jgi:hypothetical protein
LFCCQTFFSVLSLELIWFLNVLKQSQSLFLFVEDAIL